MKSIFRNPEKQFLFAVFTSVILMMLLFSGCVATEKQTKRFLAKHCIGKDSIRIEYKDKIIKKDSTAYISTPGPIQYLENPCKWLCDSLGNLKPFTPKIKKENGSKGTIFPIGNSIAFKCDIDSLAIHLKWLEHHTNTNEFKQNTVVEACSKEHRNKFDGFTYWWFWITFGIIMIWIVKTYFLRFIKR